MKNKILVTGCAGFIGYHLINRLLIDGCTVVGIDNLNDYYDPNLKKARLEQLKKHHQFSFQLLDFSNTKEMETFFSSYSFGIVIHLGAQAGVRYSLENPHAYIDANITGFINILEGCRHTNVKNVFYASSSSVYGGNLKQPFSEKHRVDQPLSLYGATKKSNEMIAHAYANLFNFKAIGLRFFTVYGPWGRPDMALFLFTKNILAQKPIQVFNHGNHARSFTYIDDIIEAIIRLIQQSNKSPEKFSNHQVFNIGGSNTVNLMDFIHEIENQLGIKAIMNFLPLQAGDVPETTADNKKLESLIHFSPQVEIQEGVSAFIKWYKSYYEYE